MCRGCSAGANKRSVWGGTKVSFLILFQYCNPPLAFCHLLGDGDTQARVFSL